jgi:hypothetical protein
MWNWRRAFMAGVKPADVPFAVPVEAMAGRVGAEFMQRLAQARGGRYERDPQDIGLMDRFDSLRGRWLIPDSVHPLIREFYEHTSRFVLAVRPQWKWYYLPAFWLFRRIVAEQIGQANLPFDVHEARQGIVSHIDTIDLDADRVVDLRGWIRTYAGSDLPVYVGIYTTVRIDDLGYVSVGFPFPHLNLTATLIPSNAGAHDFTLTTRSRDARFAGDHLVLVDEPTGRLCVYRLRTFWESIFVHVTDGALYTDHRFYFLGTNFLTLRYTITRKSGPTPTVDMQALITESASAVQMGLDRDKHDQR